MEKFNKTRQLFHYPSWVWKSWQATNISPVVNFINIFWRAFFVQKFVQSQTPSREKDFHTKNAHKRRWWNRHLIVLGTWIIIYFADRNVALFKLNVCCLNISKKPWVKLEKNGRALSNLNFIWLNSKLLQSTFSELVLFYFKLCLAFFSPFMQIYYATCLYQENIKSAIHFVNSFICEETQNVFKNH